MVVARTEFFVVILYREDIQGVNSLLFWQILFMMVLWFTKEQNKLQLFVYYLW